MGAIGICPCPSTVSVPASLAHTALMYLMDQGLNSHCPGLQKKKVHRSDSELKSIALAGHRDPVTAPAFVHRMPGRSFSIFFMCLALGHARSSTNGESQMVPWGSGQKSSLDPCKKLVPVHIFLPSASVRSHHFDASHRYRRMDSGRVNLLLVAFFASSGSPSPDGTILDTLGPFFGRNWILLSISGGCDHCRARGLCLRTWVTFRQKSHFWSDFGAEIRFSDRKGISCHTLAL